MQVDPFEASGPESVHVNRCPRKAMRSAGLPDVQLARH